MQRYGKIIRVERQSHSQLLDQQSLRDELSFDARKRRACVRGIVTRAYSRRHYDVLIPGRDHPYTRVPTTEPVLLSAGDVVTIMFVEDNPGIPVILTQRKQAQPRSFLGAPPDPIPVHYWPFYRQSPTRGSASVFDGAISWLFSICVATANRATWKVRVWEDQIFVLARTTLANNDSAIYRLSYLRGIVQPFMPQTGTVPYLWDFVVDPLGEDHDVFALTVHPTNGTVGMLRMGRVAGFTPFGAGAVRKWATNVPLVPYGVQEQRMIVGQDTVGVVMGLNSSPVNVVQVWDKESGAAGASRSLPQIHPAEGRNTAYRASGLEYQGGRRDLKDWDPEVGPPGCPLLAAGDGTPTGGRKVLPYVSGAGVYPDSSMGEVDPARWAELLEGVIQIPHLGLFLVAQKSHVPYLRAFKLDGSLAWEIDGNLQASGQKLFRPLVSTNDGRVVVHTLKLTWETVRWRDADITEMPLSGVAAVRNIRERERESRIVTSCHEYLEIYRAASGELLESQRTTEGEIVTKAYVPTGSVKLVTQPVRVLPDWENIGGVDTPVLGYPDGDKDLLDPPSVLYEIEGDYTERSAATYTSPLLAPRFFTPWSQFPDGGPIGPFLGRPKVGFGTMSYEHAGRLPLDPGIEDPRSYLDNYVDTIVERGEGAEFWSAVVAQGSYSMPNPDWDGEDPDYEFIPTWYAFKLGWSAQEVVTRISEPAVFGTERAYVSHDGKLLLLEPRANVGISWGYELGEINPVREIPYIDEAKLAFSYPSFERDEEGGKTAQTIETNTATGCRIPHYLNEDDFKRNETYVVALNIDSSSSTHQMFEEVWRYPVYVSYPPPGRPQVSNIVSTADGRTIVSVEGPRRPMSPPSSNFGTEARIYVYVLTATGTLVAKFENDYVPLPTITYGNPEGERDTLVLSGDMAILARYADLWGLTNPPPPFWSF